MDVLVHLKSFLLESISQYLSMIFIIKYDWTSAIIKIITIASSMKILKRLYFSNEQSFFIESLLVLPELGVQIETAFATGRRSSKFIAWERIEDIVIGEAITMVISTVLPRFCQSVRHSPFLCNPATHSLLFGLSTPRGRVSSRFPGMYHRNCECRGD